MSSLINILEKFKNKQPICIYQHSSEKFAYGRIIALDETDAAIYLISPAGNYDGVIVVRVDSITRIEHGGLYCERMSKLISDNELDRFPYVYTSGSNSICEWILGLSAKNQKVVSIEILDSGYDDITGIVKNIEDDCVCLQIIDKYGNPDGNAWAAIEDITQIAFSTETETTVECLFKSCK